MSIAANVGSFTITSAGGTGSKTYAHGLSVTPKVLLLWTTFPGDSARAANDLSASFGAAISSSKRRAVWMGSQNALDPSQADSRSRDDRCLMIYNGATPTLICDADFVSFDATNITLDILTAPTSDTIVFFMALGGDDLTDYELVTFTHPGSTGNYDITTVGFQGDFLLLFSTNAISLNTNTAHAALNLGFCDGVNAALASFLSEDASGSSDVRKYVRHAASQLETWARLSETSDAVIQRSSFVSWLSNGFRLNAVEATASATQIFALVLKGGKYNVRSFLSQTSTGNYNITGQPSLPKALFIINSDVGAQHTVDVPTANARFCLGAATSSTARGAAATGENDASTTNITKRQEQSITRCIIRYSVADPPVLEGDSDFVAFTADGFTLNQTDGDPAQLFNVFFTIGSFPKVVVGGTLTSAGGLNRKTETEKTGSITPSATLARKTSRALAGVVSFAGNLSRKTSHLLAGTLTLAGTLNKLTRRALSGLAGLAGALGALFIPGGGGDTFFQSVGGTLGLSGALARSTAKQTAGDFSLAGTLDRMTGKRVLGAVAAAGGLGRGVHKTLAGSLALAGTLNKKTRRALSAVLSYLGALAARVGLPNPTKRIFRAPGTGGEHRAAGNRVFRAPGGQDFKPRK